MLIWTHPLRGNAATKLDLQTRVIRSQREYIILAEIRSTGREVNMIRLQHAHTPVLGRAEDCSSPLLRTAGAGVCAALEGALTWGASGAPDAAASCCGAGMPRSACCSKVCKKSLWVDSVNAVYRLVTDSVTCQQHTPTSDHVNASRRAWWKTALSIDAAEWVSDKLPTPS